MGKSQRAKSLMSGSSLESLQSYSSYGTPTTELEALSFNSSNGTQENVTPNTPSLTSQLTLSNSELLASKRVTISSKQNEKLKSTSKQPSSRSENPAAASPRIPLSWRSDPSTSFSDWTIEILVVDKKNAETSSFFHCHSNVLAWGPRKSALFQKLFQDRLANSPSSTLTQVKLPSAEASIFPMLLDFMYCDDTLRLQASTAAPLYVLARRFKATKLMATVQGFVEKSLDFDQAAEFLTNARRLENCDKVEKLVLLANSKLCGYLVKYPTLASKVQPDLLAFMLHRRAQVLKVLKGENPRKYSGEWELERSRVLSVVVSECCHSVIFSAYSSFKLTQQTFQRLVSPKNLPSIDSDAAVKLLQVDAELQKRADLQIAKKTSRYTTTSTDSKKGTLTSFEARSLSSLVTNWRKMLEGEQDALVESLSQVNPSVLAQLLLMVSRQFQEEIAKSKEEVKQGHEILEQNLQVREFSRTHFGNDKLLPQGVSYLETVATPRHDNWCNGIDDIVDMYGNSDDYDSMFDSVDRKSIDDTLSSWQGFF